MPDPWRGWSMGLRNTSIAYGTWSFNWLVKPSYAHGVWDVVFFIADYPLNSTGVNPSEFLINGYSIGLKSGSDGPSIGPDDETIPDGAIMFYKLNSTDFSLLGIYDVPGDITGSHKIDITRNLDGKFNIYFDESRKITKTDNTTTTSENIVFGSWGGDSAFDNITVRDDVYPPDGNGTNFSSGIILLGSIGILVIIQRKKEKHT